MLSRRALGAAALALALLAAAVLGLVISSLRGGAPSPAPTVAVTLFPTLPPPLPTATPAPAPTATAAPTVAVPRPTALPQKYAVQKGDTLWDIAIKLDVSPDDLLFANPGLKPELLQIGAELNIPKAYDDTPRELGSPPARGTPYVSIEADGLRLRAAPGIGEEVLARIPAYTALKVNRRSADQAWFNITVDGKAGWVFAPYVQLNGIEAASIPGTEARPVVAAVARPGTPVARPVSSGNAATTTLLTPVPTRRPVIIPDDPYVSGIGARARQIFADGQARGNNRNAFSVIGDSNSENPKFLKYIDWGNYDLGNYDFLQETVDAFRGSFGRTSLAAFGGYGTEKILDPGASRCGRSSVECELSAHRPAVALILLGTGDQHSWQGFEARYRRIIELTISYGTIPILQTKGDDLECRDNNAPCGYINGIIVKLAREYGVPLLDLRRAINNLPARGMTGDGFHYNWPPDDRPAHFGDNYLAYGFNMRNLTALRALDAVRRQVIGG